MSLGMSVDSTLTASEEVRFKQKYRHLIKRLTKQHHFSFQEMEGLIVLYYKIWQSGTYKIQRILITQLKDVLHISLGMTNTRLLPHIVATVCKGVNSEVSLEQFVSLLSLLVRGTLEERIVYCFQVYKGYTVQDKLVRNHLIHLMSGSLIGDNKEESDESVKDLVDLIIKFMDVDRDGKISFEDYRTSVLNEPGMLQAFGPCLPGRLNAHVFLSTFSTTPRKI